MAQVVILLSNNTATVAPQTVRPAWFRVAKRALSLVKLLHAHGECLNTYF
jgi:hypothetical protein